MTEYNQRTETAQDTSKTHISTSIPYADRHLYVADGWEVVDTFTECGIGLRCTVRRPILRPLLGGEIC